MKKKISKKKRQKNNFKNSTVSTVGTEQLLKCHPRISILKVSKFRFLSLALLEEVSRSSWRWSSAWTCWSSQRSRQSWPPCPTSSSPNDRRLRDRRQRYARSDDRWHARSDDHRHDRSDDRRHDRSDDRLPLKWPILATADKSIEKEAQMPRAAAFWAPTREWLFLKQIFQYNFTDFKYLDITVSVSTETHFIFAEEKAKTTALHFSPNYFLSQRCAAIQGHH